MSRLYHIHGLSESQHSVFLWSLLQVCPAMMSRHALEALLASTISTQIKHKLEDVYQEKLVKNLEVAK